MNETDLLEGSNCEIEHNNSKSLMFGKSGTPNSISTITKTTNVSNNSCNPIKRQNFSKKRATSSRSSSIAKSVDNQINSVVTKDKKTHQKKMRECRSKSKETEKSPKYLTRHNKTVSAMNKTDYLTNKNLAGNKAKIGTKTKKSAVLLNKTCASSNNNTNNEEYNDILNSIKSLTAKSNQSKKLTMSKPPHPKTDFNKTKIADHENHTRDAVYTPKIKKTEGSEDFQNEENGSQDGNSSHQNNFGHKTCLTLVVPTEDNYISDNKSSSSSTTNRHKKNCHAANVVSKKPVSIQKPN